MTNKDEVAALLLRVVLGVTFLFHGFSKFQMGIPNVGKFFGTLGLPFPGTLAYIIVAIEIIGGVMMIIGLGTRLVAVLFAATMLGALFTTKMTAGLIAKGGSPGFELELALLVMSISLVLTGSGLYAADRMIFKNAKKAID